MNGKIISLISSDEETRELAEIREKAIIDRISQIEGAKTDAKKETSEEIAINLLDILDNETIASKTNLSIERVIELRNNQHL